MPPPIFPIQASFAGGEFSPSLYARVDINKYLTGAKTIRNFNVLPHGGARNRPGTKMVAAAGDSTHAIRLIPFVVATNQAYVIEVGNFYMRFYTQDAQVQVANPPAWLTATSYVIGNFVTNGGQTYYCLVAHTSGVFATDLAAGKWVLQTAFQIPTPYAAADIFGLRFAQSADVLYFAHPSYAPQQLTFQGAGVFNLSAFAFSNGPFMLQNTSLGNTLTPSATTNASGAAKTVSNVKSTVGWVDVVQVTTTAAHGLVANDQFICTGMTGLPSQLNGRTLTVSSVISATVVQVVVFPFIGNFNVATAGTLNKVGPITLTANFALFQANHVGALFQLKRTVVAQTVTDAGFTTNAHASTPIQCGQNWSIITLGGWTGKVLVQISTDNATTWQTIQTFQSSGTDNYQTAGVTGVSQCLLRVSGDGVTAWAGTLTIDLTSNSFDWTGVVQITAYTSSTQASATVLTTLADTLATSQWSEGSWSTLRGWPTTVTFYQDRLTWASTLTEQQTIWFSKTASYGDYGVSSPIVATDAISAVLPGRQLNAVQSLVVMPQFLVALTSDSEWAIQPAGGGAFTPETINIQLQGHRGSAAIDPVTVGIELLVIQQMGTVVRNLIFQLAVNGFFGDNISIVSQHLFTGFSIVEMSYQQEPDSVVWAVRSDGQLLSCTYMRDQEMNAWSHHDTDGLFESVCSIPNSTLGINETWFAANRTIGGVTKRFIERLMPRDQGTVPANQFFVDCGLTYSGAPATVISGLSHLEGKTVSILADGNVIAPQVVTGGTITLAVAASVVTVGLPYVCDLEALSIESPDKLGTLQGRRVVIPDVTIRFWNSRGGYAMACAQDREPADSTTPTGFDPVLQRDAQDNWDAPIPLKTRDYNVSLDGGYDFGAHVFFRQTDPLPVTILGFLPRVVAGER